MAEHVSLDISQDADVTIISVRSPRIPVEASDTFEEKVVQTVRRLDEPKVLLDFAGVQFLSSAVLGKLIKLNGAVNDRSGQLIISSLSDKIAEVFHVTNLDRLFRICDTKDKALKAFD
ncbi:MAG: STAS domain-containing protein [Planctomycetota bacterium]